MSTLRVLSTLAVMGAMKDLTSAFQAQSGISVEATFSPTVALLEEIRGGQHADVAILTGQGIDDMMAEGFIRSGSRLDVALSFVGLAVRAGAPKPDIGSVEALSRALLDARCVCYSKIGASGLFFAGLLDRLGIAGAVRTRVVPSGFTAEQLVNGEADLAVQQVSELMVVPGIEVVGRLPEGAQTVAVFSTGVVSTCRDTAAAEAFQRFLAGPDAFPVLRRCGLEPATPGSAA